MTMDDRFTIANMAIEAGGKNGIFPVDDLTVQYMNEHTKRPFTEWEADESAEYDAEYTIDLSQLKSTVAFSASAGEYKDGGRNHRGCCD